MYLQILTFLSLSLLTFNLVSALEKIGKIENMECSDGGINFDQRFSLNRNGEKVKIKLLDDVLKNDFFLLKDERCTMTLEIGEKPINLGKEFGRLSFEAKVEQSSNNVMTEIIKVAWEAVFGIPSTKAAAGSHKGNDKLMIPLFGHVKSKTIGKSPKLFENKRQLFLNWHGGSSPYMVEIKDQKRNLLCRGENIEKQKVVLKFSKPMFKKGNYYWIKVKNQDKTGKSDGGWFKVVAQPSQAPNLSQLDNWQWLFEVYQELAKENNEENDYSVYCFPPAYSEE